jgi:hypothetical protein
MTYLPSLPDNAVLLDVFRAYPNTARPLLGYHRVLLHGLSPLSVAERELMRRLDPATRGCRTRFGAFHLSRAAHGS